MVPESNELEGRDLDGVGRGAHHQERAVDAEPVDHGAHRLRTGHGREDHPGAAQPGELGRDVLGRAVEIVLRAEAAGERVLVPRAAARRGRLSPVGEDVVEDAA